MAYIMVDKHRCSSKEDYKSKSHKLRKLPAKALK